MTTLYIVRHGATEWNHTRLAQGHADIDLDAEGHRQAAAIAHELSQLPVDAVYSSDLKRAVGTAGPIAEAHGLEVRLDRDLREIDQGEWTALHVDEIKERWPDLWAARHNCTRPGGESGEQVRSRALGAVERIVRAHPEGTVVVVSHGATIRWLAAEALGFDMERSKRLRGMSNGGAIRIEARLENDELHLGDLVRLDGSTPELDDPND